MPSVCRLGGEKKGATDFLSHCLLTEKERKKKKKLSKISFLIMIECAGFVVVAVVCYMFRSLSYRLIAIATEMHSDNAE